MRTWICIFGLLLHYAAIAAASRHYNVHDCDALLNFSNSLTISEDASGGFLQPCSSSYPKTASWKNATDCCSWDGVTCHAETSSVIALDLSCSWLRGLLYSNSTLFSVHTLRRLNLAGNDFYGSQLQSRFAVFRGMEYFNLSNSGFIGPVPLGMISPLSNLITLDLSGSFFSKLTIEDHRLGLVLRNLTRLRELVLHDVDMSGISPISFSNLSSTLTSLSLSGCDLRGVFPIDIFHLPKLRSLSLSGNPNLTVTLPRTNWTGPLVSLDASSTKFQGSIPASLGNLTSVSYLDLSSCGFSGALPTTVGNMNQLTYLDLSYNNLSGSIDFAVFERLRNLEFLSLSENGFNVLLQSDGNCSFPRLRLLQLSGCKLTKFPYFLRSSAEMEHLDISDNVIGGPIPEWLGKIGMSTLINLDISSNNFTGEISSSICQVSSLYRLDLSNNRLNGTILRCLANLRNLSQMDLGNNLFHGALPQSLANCTNLVYLNVRNNEIYDAFPVWLNATGKLSSLYLQSNKFHGVIEAPLPPQLSYSIDLSNNFFSGQLPTNFLLDSKVHLINLANNSFDGPPPVPPPSTEFYFISNNNFSGGIPDQICDARGLSVVDLSNNRLTGFIPRCFINVTASLSVLDLRANKFVGHIPDIFVPKNSLMTVRLSQNQLKGTLPRSLGYCENLEVLDLSENELEGSFPDWLDTLPSLQVLVLRSNKFHGPVGMSSTSDYPFQNLRIFDLSNNNFYGPLPATYIEKLKVMQNEDRSGPLYIAVKYFYQASVVVVMKGMKIELVKILILFTTIDFSSNYFDGDIPEIVGNLKALKGLNLSHNNLSGNIPSSMGNLTNLEWLDLSSNKLNGKIPRGLADLTYLSWLNLSSNQLVGPIPQSTQFDTFNRHAFDGNPRLCGHPLPKACGPDARQTQPTSSRKEEETQSGSWFEWRAISMGCGCGLVFGISAGYIMLETGRPRWLARMFERQLLKKKSRTKKNVAPRNRVRRNTRGQ